MEVLGAVGVHFLVAAVPAMEESVPEHVNALEALTVWGATSIVQYVTQTHAQVHIPLHQELSLHIM